jgi:hypothetical protein
MSGLRQPISQGFCSDSKEGRKTVRQVTGFLLRPLSPHRAFYQRADRDSDHQCAAHILYQHRLRKLGTGRRVRVPGSGARLPFEKNMTGHLTRMPCFAQSDTFAGF